jgi:hypothetical protein
MDVMLAACFMLTALFYLCHDELNITESWISFPSESAGKPHWSMVLSGPMLLIQSPALIATANESLWSPFLSESEFSVRQASAKSGPGDKLVQLLYDLCSESYNDTIDGIDQGVTPENPYLSAWGALSPALKLHFHPETSTIGPCQDVATYVFLMSFPSRIGSNFVRQLEAHDPISLILVGFWLALLAKLQHSQW